MNEYKAGDRVRVVNPGDSQCGDEGTVISIDDFRVMPVQVQLADGVVHYSPDELEHVTVTDFKVGDAVRVENRKLGAHGRVGEVAEVLSDGLLRVMFGFGPMRLWPSELELIDTPTPDVVAHPPHYTDGTPPGIEVIDIIRAHMKAGGTWETANALKYILRHPFKDNPKQDIAKASQYLSMWTKEQEAA